MIIVGLSCSNREADRGLVEDVGFLPCHSSFT